MLAVVAITETEEGRLGGIVLAVVVIVLAAKEGRETSSEACAYTLAVFVVTAMARA